MKRDGTREAGRYPEAGFQPAPEAERRALLAKTAGAARRGEWERYKTSEMFDGTTQHPWWMETASLQR